MEKASKGVAWLCMFSTLLMGCYTSEMIEPTGDETERIRADEIRSVVLRDGTEYEFYDPPTIANDTLTGRVWLYGTLLPKVGEVRLPMSDVAKVSLSRYEPQLTLWTSVGVVVVLGVTAGIMYANAMAHLFD